MIGGSNNLRFKLFPDPVGHFGLSGWLGVAGGAAVQAVRKVLFTLLVSPKLKNNHHKWKFFFRPKNPFLRKRFRESLRMGIWHISSYLSEQVHQEIQIPGV